MLWNKAEEILNYGYCSSWSRRKAHRWNNCDVIAFCFCGYYYRICSH